MNGGNSDDTTTDGSGADFGLDDNSGDTNTTPTTKNTTNSSPILTWDSTNKELRVTDNDGIKKIIKFGKGAEEKFKCTRKTQDGKTRIYKLKEDTSINATFKVKVKDNTGKTEWTKNNVKVNLSTKKEHIKSWINIEFNQKKIFVESGYKIKKIEIKYAGGGSKYLKNKYKIGDVIKSKKPYKLSYSFDNIGDDLNSAEYYITVKDSKGKIETKKFSRINTGKLIEIPVKGSHAAPSIELTNNGKTLKVTSADDNVKSIEVIRNGTRVVYTTLNRKTYTKNVKDFNIKPSQYANKIEVIAKTKYSSYSKTFKRVNSYTWK